MDDNEPARYAPQLRRKGLRERDPIVAVNLSNKKRKGIILKVDNDSGKPS